jgi:hypothetical protein
MQLSPQGLCEVGEAICLALNGFNLKAFGVVFVP